MTDAAILRTFQPPPRPVAIRRRTLHIAGMPPISRTPHKGDHVFLVDGSSYIFRAYHALPPLTRKSDGLQLNAVYGFCGMLWKLLRDMKPEERPTHLAVVLDKSEHTFRNVLYPDYKAHRPDAPADLIPQFALIREAVRAFDLPCLEQAGFEADDLIATYVREACEAGASSTIVSSDKDLMQLVNDHVVMYDTMKDRRIGPAEVVDKFGVGPDKVIEVQALIGDSTDNVPGVPGIGVKTAAQLIGEYGDLETLLARAGEIKQQKRRETLIENADKARLSKTLVTLDRHVPLDVPLADLAVHDPDARRLIAFLKAMEFNTLTRRVAEFSGADPAEIEPDRTLQANGAALAAPAAAPAPAGRQGELFTPPSPPSGSAGAKADATAPAPGGLTPQALAEARIAAAKATKFDRSRYEAVLTLERLRHWLARAVDAGVVAVDTETTGLDPMQAELCGFSLALRPNEACYVPLIHRQGGDGTGLFPGEVVPNQMTAAEALAALKPLLEDRGVLKVGQNLKFDWQVLARHGIEIASYDDTMLMSYVARRRPQGARHGRDGRGLAGPPHHSFRRGRRDRQGEAALRERDDRQGDRIRRRGCRRDAAAVAGTQGAPRRRAHDRRLRDVGAAAGPGAGAHGAARHFHRPGDAVAAVGRVRPRSGRARGGDQGARRRAAQSGLAQAARRHPVRQDGPARGQENQDRRVVDFGPSAGRSGRGGPCAAAEDPRMAPGRKAALHLHRRAADLRQSARPTASTPAMRSPPPPPAGCPPPTPTCRTFPCAPKTAARSAAPSSPRPATSWSRPIIRRSSCGCWRRSPTSPRSSRRSATASTSMP